MKQIPSIGRIVVYNTTELERQAFQALGCNVSKQLPAVICAVWGTHADSAVNLKVMVDGNHPDLWKTSIACFYAKELKDGEEIPEENKEGRWEWPTITR